MTDLKENIENEVHSAHAEFQNMKAHIGLYIEEMETTISGGGSGASDRTLGLFT